MSLGLRTSRTAVAALLLASSAASAGTAHAADRGTTTLQVQVPALVGQLTLSTASGSVTPSATRQADGSVLVAATLPEVSISDSRVDKPGWAYDVSLPETLTSAADSGVAVQHANAVVQVPSVPLVDPVSGVVTGQTRKQGWQRFTTGVAPSLVTAAPDALSSSARFAPQLRFTLPSDTAAGEYRVVVTHSVA